MAKRQSSRLKLVLVNLSVLFAGLLALELAFGDWFSAKTVGLVSVPKDVVFHVDTSGLYPGSGEVLYRRDRYGLRGSYGSPDRIDLLTMGGSATDQHYVGEGETWQDALRARFAETGRDFRVANAGIDGQTTIGHLRNFEDWLPAIPGLKARYILFYIGWNDVFLWQDQIAGKDIVELRPSFLGRLARRSAFFRLYRVLKGIYIARRSKLAPRKVEFQAQRWTDKPLYAGDHKRLVAKKLAGYEDRVRRLAEETRKAGATPIFVTQASYAFRPGPRGVEGMAEQVFMEKVPVNGMDLYRLLNAFHDVTMAVCRKEGAVCLDLARELRFEDGDFYDPAHNTPAGARKVGGYLFDRLKALP